MVCMHTLYKPFQYSLPSVLKSLGMKPSKAAGTGGSGESDYEMESGEEGTRRKSHHGDQELSHR